MELDIQEQWKAAVMPVALGVLDGHELADDAWYEVRERLENLGVPAWAISLRDYYFSSLIQDQSPLLSQFVIRAEVAMAGLWLLYPKDESRVSVYQRVALMFLHETLRPYVDRATTTEGDALHLRFDGVCQLYRLCEDSRLALEPQRWADIVNSLQESPEHYQTKREGFGLTVACFDFAHAALFTPDDDFDIATPGALMSQLSRHSDHPADQGEGVGPGITGIAVSAFLAALERECPPPAWMPAP